MFFLPLLFYKAILQNFHLIIDLDPLIKGLVQKNHHIPNPTKNKLIFTKKFKPIQFSKKIFLICLSFYKNNYSTGLIKCYFQNNNSTPFIINHTLHQRFQGYKTIKYNQQNIKNNTHIPIINPIEKDYIMVRLYKDKLINNPTNKKSNSYT
jgi:hypothetical protein